MLKADESVWDCEYTDKKGWGDTMKVLFVYDDAERSSFFVYDLTKGVNSLLRVAPEVKINQVSLGYLYTQVPIEKFLAYFGAAFSLEIKKYLVLKKSDSLNAIKEAGLEEDGKMSVIVAKDFTGATTGQRFTKGEQRLTLSEIDAYITYQIDDDGRIDVFERQEDLIRLMKRRTVKPSLSAITQNLGTVQEFSASNLNLKDMLKMGTGYLAKGNSRMNKINVPAVGTYQLVGDFPYQLGQIDWAQNQIQLVAELRE